MANKQGHKRGYMYFNLKGYLAQLEASEAAKPDGEQRTVPSLTDLARAAGVHKVTMSKLVRGQIRSLNFDIGTAIIAEMRRNGFETQPGDLFGYEEGNDA